MLQIAQSGATSLSRKERKQAQHNDDLRPDHQQSYEAKWNERTSGFINYAKKHGRLDLAQQIKDDAHQAFATFQKERVYIDVSTKTFDYNYNLLQFSDLLSIAGVVLMLSLLSSFIVWIIISIYELFLTRKSTFLLERYSPQLSESILGIIACSALWSILCGIILSAGLITITNTTPGTLADLSNGWLLLPFSVHFYFDNFINKVLEFSGITHQKDYFLPTWRVLILLTPILMGSLYVSQKRIEWQAKSNGKKVWSGWALFRRFFSRRWDRPFVTGLLGWIGKRIFILLFFLCWGALTFTSQFMNAEDQTNQIILAVFTIVLLLSALFWLIRAIKPASFPYGFQLFKQSLAGWISFASVLILATLIGSVIINRPLQKWADTEMRGEMWQIHRVKNMPATKR
jgi:hypothetical protein